MNKNDKIIRFYLITHKLKDKIRTGWQEIGITKDRLESVAEHIYGCLMLAIAIESEYEINIDMYKALKMLALHELEETLMKDFTIRDNITREEKIKLGRESVKKVVSGLIKEKEIEELLEEFNMHETKESLFCFYIDKIECDFQAKIYDLEGNFKLEKALEDLDYFGQRSEEIRSKIKNPSDTWIEYDKIKYKDDEIFKNLIEDIQKLSNLDV